MSLADASISIITAVDVPVERIADTLCCALEGGSTYWCRSCTVDDFKDQEWAHEAIALGTELVVYVTEEDEPTHVNANELHWKHTLTLFSSKYPRHFGDMMGNTEDAETGDILFQLLCFGEVVYG